MNDRVYACSLTDRDLPKRRAEWQRLERKGLLQSESVPGGQRLVYGGGEETAGVLGRLVDAERDCCPFLDMTVRRRGDEVHLTISFPPEAGPAVAELGLPAL